MAHNVYNDVQSSFFFLNNVLFAIVRFSIAGLCGNFDSDTDNDFVKSDGSLHIGTELEPKPFVLSWRCVSLFKSYILTWMYIIVFSVIRHTFIWSALLY